MAEDGSHPNFAGYGTSMGQVGTDAALGRLLRQKATRGLGRMAFGTNCRSAPVPFIF